METIRIKKKYNKNVIYKGDRYPTKLTKESKDLIGEYIDKGTLCVCAYNSIDEYKYSTMSTKYLSIDVMDAVARITFIDYNECEVEMEFMPECSDPNSYRYINPDDFDKYDLILRGIVMSTARSSEADYTGARVIGFDMIKRREN